MFNRVSNMKKINTDTNKIIFPILIAIVSFVILLIFQEKLENYYDPKYHLSFHTILEFFSITVSLTIAIQAKLVYQHTYSRRNLFIGGIFLAVGCLDLFHVLTYHGMPHFFGESSVQKATWFWVLARLTQTIGAFFVFSFKEKNEMTFYQKWIYPFFLLYTFICVFIVFYFEDRLFLLVVEGEGTTFFKNMLEYFICLLLLTIAFIIYKEYKKKSEIYYAEIIIAIAYIFLGELFFTKYMSVNDFGNMVGHIYKAIGFYFLLKAIFYKSTTEPYLKKFKAEKRLKSIVQTIPCGITIVDKSGTFTYLNKSAENILGVHSSEILGKKLEEINLHIDHQDNNGLHQETCGIDFVLRTKKPLFNIQAIVMKNNQNRAYITVNSAPLFSADGTISGVVSAIQDKTEKKKDEEKMHYLAYYDTLTGLPNRSRFIELCTKSITHLRKVNKKAAVIFLDIDEFKKINDILGHNVGDMFIKNVALRLETLLNENIVVARMGGDEFGLLLTGINDQNEVNQLVNKILFTLQKPHNIHNEDIRLTASLGISIFPDDGDDIEVLMRKADIALFRAKKEGRGYSYYSPDIDTYTFDSLMIEQQLRRAIDREELKLFYQPQISLKTEKVTGFEALIRWDHPNKGMISPSIFIPIAEQTGLIIELGNWILREACKQIKRWHQNGLEGVTISVNLSIRQFLDSNLSNNIKKILEEVQLNPKFLILEITESMAVNGEQTIKTLHELKEIGIEIAMDDFGTGYSSLSSLKAFPIDQLKIDQSFIRELDQQNKSIVSSIISLANHLNLSVVAEGVETEEQLQFLKASRCDEVQGYYIEKPLPPHSIEEKYIYKTVGSSSHLGYFTCGR